VDQPSDVAATLATGAAVEVTLVDEEVMVTDPRDDAIPVMPLVVDSLKG
jgi:hypothetical protein